MEEEKSSIVPSTKKEIRWTAEEYPYHEKSVDWYWYFGLIVLLLGGFTLYLRNILFFFIIAIGSFSMIMYANKRPRKIEYKVTDKNISFDDVSYSFQDTRFFYIINDKKQSNEKLLLLQLNKATSVIIIIPLGDTDLDELYTFLLNFIEEKRIDVPAGYTIMNLIGF